MCDGRFWPELGRCRETARTLLPLPTPSQQIHQRIEERSHCRRVLGERGTHRYRGLDADRILARVNRSLGRKQLLIVSHATVQLPIAGALDPYDQAIGDGRCAVRRRDQRVELGVG